MDSSSKGSNRKEKVLAIMVIITSVCLLIAVMLLGKMLGRDMSLRQELLKDQFQLKNMSGNQNVLEYSKSQQKLELLPFHCDVSRIVSCNEIYKY